MKGLLWFLALAAAAVALTLAAHNPGYVLLVYAPYRIEVSLTLFTLGLLALLTLSFVLVKLVAAALQLPQQVRQFRLRRKNEKARTAAQAALTAFFEGRYPAAENCAKQALELGDRNPTLAVLAARAAHQQGKSIQRDAYLALLNGTPDSADLLLRTRADFGSGS